MRTLTKWTTKGSIATLATSVSLAGLIALSQAPLDGIGAQFGNGHSQRLYEERFDDAFPLRDEAQALWAAAKLGVLGEAAEGAVIGREGWLFTAEEFAPPSDEVDARAEFRAIRDVVASVGGTLLVVPVPDKARMMSDRLPRTRSSIYEQRYDRLLALLAAEDIRHLDIRQALRPGAGNPLYLRTDTHWSPAGAAQVSTAIATAIHSEVINGAGFVTQKTGEQAFVGDLAAFVDTGRWQPWVGPQPETIATFETKAVDSGGGLGLFDDVTVEIALVGTSFSARPTFHFEGFLKSALGADVLNHAQVGQGPFRPMHAFLSAINEVQTPPRIVIWEIPERYINPRSL